MTDEQRDWSGGGRPLRWRFGMLAGGLLIAGYGAALVVWPWLLAWTVAAACGALGLICVTSAILARSRRG